MGRIINKHQILGAAKASMIPEGISGYWYIFKKLIEGQSFGYRGDKFESVPPGVYTYLCYIDKPNEPAAKFPVGEIVMEDTPQELSSHLNFMLKAKGNVLVTGLGLGCVVRGLLKNPNVRHITCVERSSDVLALVKPYMPKGRLTIIQADAVQWTRDNRNHFDCAYHDLWTDKEKGEPALQVRHAELLLYCKSFTKFQSAWELPRWFKRRISGVI